jgi:hypothetical protein
MTTQEFTFSMKMKSIGFQPHPPGERMSCNIGGVEIVAVESPLGIHLHFSRCTPREITDFEVKAPGTCSASGLAALIVKNLESVFSDIARAGKA